MDIDIARCCCFTGHRPEKLSLPESGLRHMLHIEIASAIADGYDTFISGMARGIDMLAAEEVLSFAALPAPPRLICACPYRIMPKRHISPWRIRYADILRRAAGSIFVSDQYSPRCFEKRNRWMVEHSSRVIAVFDGTHGGTRNTLILAADRRLDIRVLLIGG